MRTDGTIDRESAADGKTGRRKDRSTVFKVQYFMLALVRVFTNQYTPASKVSVREDTHRGVDEIISDPLYF